MQIVIEIPEEDYKNGTLINYFRCYSTELDKIIYSGTPLPEPFDLEGLKSDMKALNCGFPYGLDYLLDCLNKRLGITITEAEMSGGGEDEVGD